MKQIRQHVLGERLLREYRKTAEVVGCQPWNLLKARTYLENLCLDNETGRVPQPPVLSAVVHYQMKDMGIAPVVQMVSGAPVQPRRVFAETPTPAEQRRRAKRKAAAALSLDASEAEDPKSADSAAPPPAADTGAPPKGANRQHVGKHWTIWIVPDGTTHASRKRAEAAGFIDA